MHLKDTTYEFEAIVHGHGRTHDREIASQDENEQ